MGPLFFPDVDPLTALINTYGIFAAGYLMRPLGGVIFGRIGDLMGRKKALQLSIIMMAVPTVLVGMLPVYEQIGAFAAVLLVLLRLMQGISVGGELTGSMSYLVETAPANRRGLGG
jgi:MHS family proline/betaine transporter-like MFS transporter